MPTINDVPDGVLEQILSLFKFSDRVSCMDVCERWRVEVKRLFNIYHHFEVHDNATLRLFLSHVPNFRQLRELTISKWISGKELDLISTCCPHLKKLSVKVINPLLSLAPENLRELNIYFHCYVHCNVIQQLASRCAATLSHLSLHNMDCHLFDGCLLSLGNSFPALLSLCLSNCRFGDRELSNDVDCLLNLTTLQSLSISKTNLQLAARIENILKTFQDLHSLYLDVKSCESLVSWDVLLAFRSAPSLQHLYLDNIPISDDTLQVLSRMKRLTSLHLNSLLLTSVKHKNLLQTVTPAGLVFLHRCLHPDFKLKVTLSSSDQAVDIPQEKLDVLSTVLTLRELELVNCRLTQAQITRFLQNAVYLEKITVTSISEWSESHMELLGRLPALKRIEITSSSGLTSASVVRCLQLCDVLETITVTGINMSLLTPRIVAAEVSATLFKKLVVKQL